MNLVLITDEAFAATLEAFDRENRLETLTCSQVSPTISEAAIAAFIRDPDMDVAVAVHLGIIIGFVVVCNSDAMPNYGLILWTSAVAERYHDFVAAVGHHYAKHKVPLWGLIGSDELREIYLTTWFNDGSRTVADEENPRIVRFVPAGSE